MKRSYIKLFPLCPILCIAIIIGLWDFHGQAVSNNFELLSVGSDQFLLCESSPITVSLVDSSGTLQTKMTEKDFTCQNVQVNTSGVYLFCPNNFEYEGYIDYAAVMIICNKSGTETEQIFFDDISLKLNCAVYDNNRIYLVDERLPDSVKIYTKDGGSPQTTVSVGSAIQRLFAYDNAVFALTANTVYSVTSFGAAKIGTVIPQSDFCFYESFCCTADGKIYTFDTQNGFSLYFSSNYQYTVLMKNKIYAADGKKIYCLDDSGTVTSVYTANGTITALSASNASLAFVSDGAIHVISAKDFTAVQSDASSVTSEISQVSKAESSRPSASQSSAITVSDQIQSSIYNMNQSIIEISCGKTIAQIKREITYTGYTAQFYDYNNKSKASGTLGTGASLILSSHTESYTYTFLVRGDITGEGNINTRDTAALLNYLIQISELTALQLQAADLNNDNIVDTADLLSLYKQIALL